MAASNPHMDRYLADKAPPVCSLNIADSFKALTKQESAPLSLVLSPPRRADRVHAQSSTRTT